MNLQKLLNAIEKSWSRETCHIPLQNKWTKDNSVLGQCVVTTLIIQDYFGGEIIHDIKSKHYWNILPDGTTLDITRHQFSKNTKFNSDEVIERDSLFQPQAKTKERYDLLKQKTKQYLKNNS